MGQGSGRVRIQVEQSELGGLVLRHLLGRRARRVAFPAVGSLQRHAKNLFALEPVAETVTVSTGCEAVLNPACAERRRADGVVGSDEAGQRICAGGPRRSSDSRRKETTTCLCNAPDLWRTFDRLSNGAIVPLTSLFVRPLAQDGEHPVEPALERLVYPIDFESPDQGLEGIAEGFAGRVVEDVAVGERDGERRIELRAEVVREGDQREGVVALEEGAVGLRA